MIVISGHSHWIRPRVLHCFTSKTEIDDVIDDVIEKLFGSALHDEFDEFTKNCLNYDAAFKVCSLSPFLNKST